MFEGQQADLSLFLNAVGDAFVVNESTIWNRENPKDAAGRDAVQSLGDDARISFMDTYMIRFGGESNSSAVPGFTMLEPDYSGKLEGNAQASYGLSLRKLIRDIDQSLSYTPNTHGSLYTRAARGKEPSRRALYMNQGKALIKYHKDKAAAIASGKSDIEEISDKSIKDLLAEYPELSEVDQILEKSHVPAYDPMTKQMTIKPVISDLILSQAKTAVDKVASLADVTDVRKPVADNSLMEANNKVVLLRKTTVAGGTPLNLDNVPDKLFLGVTTPITMDSSVFYGDDSQGTIPVTQFKLADTAVNKTRYPELSKFSDDLEIWTNTENGDFVVVAGENVSPVYSHSTSIRRPNVMKKTGTGIVETDTPFKTYNGFVILSADGDPVVQEDVGKVVGQVAIYAVDGMPFMHTEADENNVIRWVSDREPGKIMAVEDIQVAPVDEEPRKGDVPDPEISRLDTSTRLIEGKNRNNIILMELLCAPSQKADEVSASWNEALRLLGYDPKLVGGLTDKDKIGLKNTSITGYDRSVRHDTETVATTASFDHGKGEWILPGQIVDLQSYKDRFIPTVRELAGRLLYIHRLATFWGRGEDRADLQAVYDIVGGKEQYDRDKEEGKLTKRNIVGEKVSLWLNQQSEKLINAVKTHYDRKTQWLNEMLADGRITENDIRDHVNGIKENQKQVHIDFDGSNDGTFATAFKSAMMQELSLDEDLSNSQIREEAKRELDSIMATLDSMGTSKDTYSATMENKVLKRFVEAYDKGGIEAARDSLNTDEHEVLRRLSRWKKKYGNYRYNSEKLSDALGRLQRKEPLTPIDQRTIKSLQDFITGTSSQKYVEDDVDIRDHTKENALAGIQRLLNGEDLTNNSEIKAIQKVVTQKNAPIVTRTIQDMAITGLLGSNRTVKTLLDKDGNLQGDLLNSLQAITRLVQSRAIVPLMTDVELEKEWEDWSRRNNDLLYSEARELAKSFTTQYEIDKYERECQANNEPCNMDQFYMEKIKDNPQLLLMAGYRMPGGARRAVTKFVQQVFPRWIMENKRYRLVNPAQCRHLLDEVLGNFNNIQEQIIPRNVFLTPEDREQIRRAKLGFVQRGNLEDQYGRITDRVYLASTGNIDPYKRRFVNSSTISEDEIQDEDMMNDWVQNLTLQATDGTFATVPKWIRAECDAKTAKLTPDLDVLGRVVGNTIVESILDKADYCLGKFHFEDGDTISRLIRNDPTLKQKLLEATNQAATEIAEYMAGDRRFEYERKYEKTVRDDVAFDLIDSIDRTLVNGMSNKGYTQKQIDSIRNKFIAAWSKQNHILPSFDTVNHELRNTPAVSIMTGEVVADEIMNKLEKAIYEQSVPMKHTVVDPNTGQKRQEYIMESDGVTKKLFKVKDTPKLQGLLRAHIQELRNNMRNLCINQCSNNRLSREERLKSVVGFLG